MPTLRRMIRFSPLPKSAACALGLFAVLLTLEGCFFFRSKPDTRAREITSRLSPGLTTDEVLELVWPTPTPRAEFIRQERVLDLRICETAEEQKTIWQRKP